MTVRLGLVTEGSVTEIFKLRVPLLGPRYCSKTFGNETVYRLLDSMIELWRGGSY